MAKAKKFEMTSEHIWGKSVDFVQELVLKVDKELALMLPDESVVEQGCALWERQNRSTGLTIQCHFCGRFENNNGDKPKKCSRCRRQRYCDRQCQKLDWKTHKADCVTQP